jgi:hypothetical protein
MFLHKPVRDGSLTLPFEPFRFLQRIRGYIRIWKTTPRYQRYGESATPHISDTGSRQFPVSMIRWVADSPHRWYGELAIEFFWKKTLRIGERESCRLPASVIQWVADSLYPWVWESTTPHITDTESWRLRISLSRGVDTPCIGESLSEKISTTGNGCELDYCEWDLAEKWKRTNRVVRASVLTANAEVATILGSIPASSVTVKIWGVADEAVFNTLHRDIEKNPKKSPYYNFYNRKNIFRPLCVPVVASILCPSYCWCLCCFRNGLKKNYKKGKNGNDYVLPASVSRGVAYRWSVILGVDNSACQWYGVSPTLRIGDSGSRCLNTFWKKTPHITDTRSRRLLASLIRRVVNSPHRWYGESSSPPILDTVSPFLKKN